MKRVFLFFLASLLIFFGLLYGLLFTPFGNSIVASYIQKSANENVNAVFEVKEFSLTTSKIKFIATIDKSSQIDVVGDLALLQKRVDLNYEINIKDLSKLQKFTKQKLNGNFFTKGTVVGDEKLTKIDGISNVFDSKTTYNIKLKDFKPSDIKFLIQQARIKEILYTLNQPNYASGFINIDGKIKNPNIPTLDGLIATTITDGKVNNEVVNKAFNQKLKNSLTFKGDIVTNLEPNKAVSKIDFFTSMANIIVKQAVVNLKNMNINSDYLLSIPSLANLYDVTQTKMRGALNIDGNIEKTPTTTKVTGTSNILDGNLDFTLLNDDFKANLKNLDIRKLTYMMYYPDFFTSKADANIIYNLKTQKGDLVAKLINGQFLPNEFSKLINTFAKFDITREVYESIDVKSNIDKKVIKSIIDMKSKLTQINVTDSKIDLQNSTVDALVKTQLKGVEFDTVISGDLKSPKVSIDTTNLLKLKLKEESEKVIKKHSKRLEEKLTEKLGEKQGKKTSQEIIEGFRKFFGGE